MCHPGLGVSPRAGTQEPRARFSALGPGHFAVRSSGMTNATQKRTHNMVDAVSVSTARAPVGRAVRGAFNVAQGADRGGHVVANAVKRAGIEPGDVEDVTMGCANPE